jgi:carboxylate-amine ligase
VSWLAFKGSEQASIGIELELQIIDKKSKKLSPIADAILADLDHPAYKHELFQSTVEIVTTPALQLQETEKELRQLLGNLLVVGEKWNAGFIMTGTHPFTSWEEQKITALPRYKRMIERITWPARRMMIFGLHIHIALPGGNEAIAVANSLLPYLPVMLALSTSSPFWANTRTGLASCRAKIFESIPTAGVPEQFRKWGEYCDFVETMIKLGSIDSHRDIWWDIRPHPDYGTIEIRVFDAVPTLPEVLSLAALTQALTLFIQEKRLASLAQLNHEPQWRIKENKWRAARFGLAAKLIDRNNSGNIPVRNIISELLVNLMPYAEKMGNAAFLRGIETILTTDSSAARQIAVYKETGGDMTAIIDNLARELQASI